MSTTQEVIYRAANLEQADLLASLLREEGIRAEVTNAMLQQVAGGLPFGGPIEPRVIVDGSDAIAARRVAMEFERGVARRRLSQGAGDDSTLTRAGKFGVKAFFYLFGWFVILSALVQIASGGSGRANGAGIAVWAVFLACTTYLLWPSRDVSQVRHEADGAAEDESEPNVATHWPTCPDCARRRHTSCPICETAGTNFPMGFVHDADGPGASPHEGSRNLLVICPTCDEPFVAEFARRCEWCGHAFADGRELPMANDGSVDEVNPRLWIAAIALVLVVAGAVMFLAYYALPR